VELVVVDEVDSVIVVDVGVPAVVEVVSNQEEHHEVPEAVVAVDSEVDVEDTRLLFSHG